MNIEKLEREVALLREKAALLEKCLEYERQLKEMREATPKEPAPVPSPSMWWDGPYTVRFDDAAADPLRVGIANVEVPGPNERVDEWVDASGNVHQLGISGGGTR